MQKPVNPFYLLDIKFGDYVGFQTYAAAVQRAEELPGEVDIYDAATGNTLVRVGVVIAKSVRRGKCKYP